MRTVAKLPGQIKVNLSFHTWEPVHIRSHVLKTEFKAEPPFIEYVSVWLRPDRIYDRLSAYQKVFDHLLTQGIVPQRSKLHGFVILDEDDTTLAYTDQGEDLG